MRFEVFSKEYEKRAIEQPFGLQLIVVSNLVCASVVMRASIREIHNLAICHLGDVTHIYIYTTLK